jgi:hypothetical protein
MHMWIGFITTSPRFLRSVYFVLASSCKLLENYWTRMTGNVK